MTIFSTEEQLEQIAKYLRAYARIPHFQDDTVPGSIMEKIIALVRGGIQLPTYDYVDVCIRGNVGWQVKSTKNSTPLTWKRAKVPNAPSLIKASRAGRAEAKVLGDAIIDFCNRHAAHSLARYDLKEIGYSRLIMFPDGGAIYFEKSICTVAEPWVFNKDEYTWHWTAQKVSAIKEQLPSFTGTNLRTGRKSFAWHGLGENQLHFPGEKEWWPDVTIPTAIGEMNFSADGHAIAFRLAKDKVCWDSLTSFLTEAT
ncbi:hypothetical protein [Alcaligenes aquatilis]|uniref:hypothetical protein n=1 Tax=Alcaligenes aquatilis TaxID=323284 RepID=UPI003620D576